MKTYNLDSVHEVHIDHFENGEGELSYTYGSENNITANSPQEAVEKFISETLIFEMGFDKLEINDEDNSMLMGSVLVDEFGLQVKKDSEDYEEWKKGNVVLYSDSFTINVYELKPVNFIREKFINKNK